MVDKWQKRKNLLLCISIISAFIYSAYISKPPFPDFLGCWTHSFEENPCNSNLKIYRPCGHKIFLSTEYRFQMILKNNKTCEYLYLATNGKLETKKGTWSFKRKYKTLTLYNLENNPIKKFEIIKIKNDILKIKPLKNMNK